MTLGVLARLAGSSNKVAAATAAIFSVSNLVILYANSQIDEIKKIPFTALSGDQLNIPKWLISFATSSAVNFAAGRALRPWIAQQS